jgi:hypothetical protein
VYTVQAGAVDAAELAMYAALMTNNTNMSMVEYLMAGMWILLKHPDNRKVLGEAFQVGTGRVARASVFAFPVVCMYPNQHVKGRSVVGGSEPLMRGYFISHVLSTLSGITIKSNQIKNLFT